MKYIELALAIYGFFSIVIKIVHYRKKGDGRLSEKRIAQISNEDLAQYEFGVVESGLKVYVFHVESGELKQTYTDRYRCSRELDMQLYHQVKAFTGIHAVSKFKKWKDSAWKKQL